MIYNPTFALKVRFQQQGAALNQPNNAFHSQPRPVGQQPQQGHFGVAGPGARLNNPTIRGAQLRGNFRPPGQQNQHRFASPP